MASGLLVSYSGLPLALSSLFPDNGLAILAAVLREEGHQVTILDWCTSSMVERLVDGQSRAALRRLWGTPSGPERWAGLDTVSRQMEALADRVVDELAHELVTRCVRDGVEFVGFKLWSGDGFRGSVRMAQQLRARCPQVRLFAGGPAVHFVGPAVAAEAPVFDAVVDGDGEQALLDLMEEMNRERGATFLFSTHDQKVMDRAKRIIHMQDGRVLHSEDRNGASAGQAG